MEPVLIYKDEEKIEEEIHYLNMIVDYFQNLYNGVKAIGVNLTISDLSNITQLTFTAGLKIEAVERFIKDKLIEKAGPAEINGVPVKRSILELYIEMPDVAPIFAIIMEHNLWRKQGIRTNLLVITNDVISKIANADALLDTEYTYLTKTDFGATLATHLKTICEALNNFATVYPIGQYGNGWGVSLNNGGLVPGVAVRKSSFIPDLHFIRERE